MQIGRPTHMMMDPKAHVVFDSRTGAYKRHWGAYGAMPSDDKPAACDPSQPPSKQLGNPTAGSEPGGKFIAEYRVEPLTRANGSVCDMVLSHDAAQKYVYIAEGAKGRGEGSTGRATSPRRKSASDDVFKSSPSCRSSLYAKLRPPPLDRFFLPCIKEA